MAAFLDSLAGGPVLRTFVQYLIAFCSRPETASDVISGRFVGSIVPNKHVTNLVIVAKTALEKFHLKLSKAAFSTVCRDNFQPDVGCDVISGMHVEKVGVDVRVNLGDSRSKGI